MANNEENNQGEDVVGRRDNEDQDDVPNIGDGHHNADHTPEGVDSFQLEFQNEVTQFSVELNTLASGNVLYDDFEPSQHSRLYALFQALKEGNIDSVKNLFPGIEDPVSVSVEQDGGKIQPSAPLINQPFYQHS